MKAKKINASLRPKKLKLETLKIAKKKAGEQSATNHHQYLMIEMRHAMYLQYALVVYNPGSGCSYYY